MLSRKSYLFFRLHTKMQYIIDGYNLLHKTNFESREGMIDALVRFCHVCNKNAKIVFDGYAPEEFASTRVQVVFAGDADVEIIKLLNEAQTPTFYTLVSSDNELREVAKRKKIKIIKAEEFDLSLPDKSLNADKPTCYLNDDEIKKQLKEFNNFKK